MIRAYDEELLAVVEPDLTVAEHVQRSILARTRNSVKEAIFTYLGRYGPAEAIYDLLGRITSDERLLSKTRIVSDRRYGNCVILVTPEGARATVGAVTTTDGTCNLEATLHYWRLHAEVILVQLAEPGYTEEKKPAGESLEYLLHWHFKRFCQNLTNLA